MAKGVAGRRGLVRHTGAFLRKCHGSPCPRPAPPTRRSTSAISSDLPPPSAAYKEEHERNFLRSVFRQYKEGYPLDRLFPSRVYRSLQERSVIHHSRAEKLYALSLFKNYRPTSRLYMPEEARQAIINSKAMAWLLKREFDAMTELRFITGDMVE